MILEELLQWLIEGSLSEDSILGMYRDGLGGVRRKVMSDKELVSMGSKSFEDLKKINEYGAEYWSAREIQPLLGYTQWRRFEDAVKRAITSCKSSGNEPTHHFANAGKPIAGGKGAVQLVNDYQQN